MPTQVSALGFLRLMTNMKLTDTLIPLFLPSIAAPTVYYFMISYMKSNLPMEIIEAARIDGSGEYHTFNYIVLPIMKPALAVQAIFTFVGSWNNYFVPALVLTSSKKKTLPILIAQLRSADFLKFDMGQVYMLIAIAIMPVIVVYLLLSKFIVGRCLGRRKGLTAQGYFGHCFCDYTFPQDGKSAEKPLLCRLFIFPFFSVCVMILSTKKNMEVHRHELSQGLHLGRGNRVLPNRGCCF